MIDEQNEQRAQSIQKKEAGIYKYVFLNTRSSRVPFLQSITTSAPDSVWCTAWTNARASSRNIHPVRIVSEDERHLCRIALAWGNNSKNTLIHPSIHPTFPFFTSVRNVARPLRGRRPTIRTQILTESRSPRKRPQVFNLKPKRVLHIVVNSKRSPRPQPPNHSAKVRQHQGPIDVPSRAPRWHEIWLVPHQHMRMQHLQPRRNLPPRLSPKSWRFPSDLRRLGVLPVPRTRQPIRRRPTTSLYPIKNKRLPLSFMLAWCFSPFFWFCWSHWTVGIIELYTIFCSCEFPLLFFLLQTIELTENRFFYSSSSSLISTYAKML